MSELLTKGAMNPPGVFVRGLRFSPNLSSHHSARRKGHYFSRRWQGKSHREARGNAIRLFAAEAFVSTSADRGRGSYA